MAGTATALGVAETEPSAPAAPRVARRALLGGAAGVVLLAALRRAAAAVPRGERRLALYNPHTDERFDDVYWCDGTYVATSLRRVNWLMRDFHQDKVAAIDPELLDLLQRLAALVETDGSFCILSGYRTAATNRLLRREGLAPAAHSEHLLGKAADICIDGVRLRHLRLAALSLQCGGVGTYWRDGFIHLDVGPVRVW
ncbi:MAG: DUF882 domain-containing protein [Stellaceae bacterium]